MKKKQKKTIFQKKKIDEQFFIETVEKITQNLVHKFKFGYHTPADIKQQAYIYAIEGLKNTTIVDPRKFPLDPYPQSSFQL